MLAAECGVMAADVFERCRQAEHLPLAEELRADPDHAAVRALVWGAARLMGRCALVGAARAAD